MSKYKYLEIKDNISPTERQIYLIIETWFYPKSLKLMLLRKFIPLYRDYTIAIEEHYNSVLETTVAENISTMKSDMGFLLFTTKKNLEHFEKEFDKIYLDSTQCC